MRAISADAARPARKSKEDLGRSPSRQKTPSFRRYGLEINMASNKLILLGFCLLFRTSALLCAQTDLLPRQFTVQERFFALTPTFDVESKDLFIASAKRRFFHYRTVYELTDQNGDVLAVAEGRLFSWGAAFDIYDNEHRLLGSFQEEIFRILPWAEYFLFDAAGDLAGTARMNLFGTSFDLFSSGDPTQIHATLWRPFIRIFRDFWTVSIQESSSIDPRLVICLSVIQTDKDNRDRFRNEIRDFLIREKNDFDGRRLGG